MGHVCRWPRTLRNAKKKWLRPRCATRKGWSGATLEPLPGWAYPDRRSNQRSGSWESTGTASNPCEFLYPQSLNLSRLQGNGSFKFCPFDLLIEILCPTRQRFECVKGCGAFLRMVESEEK